ncbi:hypothetical protein ACQ4M3_03205 [Leptolyngbya sp. AN03gr2]|uniref:hypothetical protein n=1 Tax=unclassified Leptolyngbya TaxID=2650499 RepID=UPI003D314F13
MTEHQELIKSLLQDLNAASQLIDGLAEKVQALENSFDRSRFIGEIGKTLAHIFDLEADLFELEPTLVPDLLKPSLDAVDLTDSLERLLSKNWAIRESTIREFKAYMLDQVESEFAFACESETEHDFAQEWWCEQQKPFIPVVRVYKFLKHDRRFMRCQSAKLLEERFGVQLWDDERGDVCFAIAEQWFNDWLGR